MRGEFHSLAVAFFVIAVVVIGDVQFILSPVVLQAATWPIEVYIFPRFGLAVLYQAARGERGVYALVAGVDRESQRLAGIGEAAMGSPAVEEQHVTRF